MKLKDCYITHQNKDDYMMLDASGSFAGLIHSNATTAFIADCLRTETTRDEVIRKCLAKYEASEDDIAESVDMVISKFRSIGAIEE